jgi:aryl-alcohol dehydrogenase-like predicted oxidoreductase
MFFIHIGSILKPLEETMMALDYAVRSGKALYAEFLIIMMNKLKAAVILKD